MTGPSYIRLRDIGREFGVEIHRPGASQLHFLVQTPAHLMRLCSRLRDEGCFLVTLVANDERELEDDCFKLYYFFSHPTDHVFLAVEYGLPPGREVFPSIYPIYPAVEPFEREVADLMGLLPEQPEPRMIHQSYLHASYPAGLYPLRRDWSQQRLQRLLEDCDGALDFSPQPDGMRRPPAGELYLPVGPIHAGVIEPGNFTFRISGEMIEGMELLLGYTHKGIERLYQRNFDLSSGWKLAERVAGDSSFAHSLAYSKAVEVLTGANVPPPAHLLRAIFLELERFANHIGDCAALANDLALSLAGAELAVLRERVLRLNASLTGSRFLRGVNCPGGVKLPRPLETWEIRATTREIIDCFLGLAQSLIERADFRERTIGVGVLPRDTALQLGVTGLVARASGIQRDFRVQHPFGPYNDSPAQALLADPGKDLPVTISRQMQGDVFSRFIARVIEAHTAQRLIEYFLDHWTGGKPTEFWRPVDSTRAPNFEWGLGYAEGWRGDVVYWVMKDKFERIYRCKVRDPSTLNWPGVKAAVASERQGMSAALGDFPIINKSFNLSYSGNDL